MSEQLTFREQVWLILASIPAGRVTTYGDIAHLTGHPRAARQVGGILKKLPAGSTLPWFRVINREGKISLTSEDFLRQKTALLAEDIEVNAEGYIDLEKYRWPGQDS